MSKILHTPYDGSAKPFQIGLKPLDINEWIDVDEHLGHYLDEKDRLIAERRSEVFAAEPGTEDGQAEVLRLLAEYLPRRFPQMYRREGEHMVLTTGHRVALDSAEPALLTAARLVQEDLVLMRNGETGWRLAAASLSFPSSWKLADKFMKPMHEVHAPVPGFAEGTRNAGLIERMFTYLQVAIPVIRWNWSLFGDAALFHPESAHPKGRFGMGERAKTLFFWVERQTLRKLPRSGDILFTIRIYVDPIAELEKHPDAPGIASALIAQIDEMSDEQADYKGLSVERARLVSRLGEIASRT